MLPACHLARVHVQRRRRSVPPACHPAHPAAHALVQGRPSVPPARRPARPAAHTHVRVVAANHLPVGHLVAQAVCGLVRVHGHVQHVGGVHGQDGVSELGPVGTTGRGVGVKLPQMAPGKDAAQRRRPTRGRWSPHVQTVPNPSRPAPAPPRPRTDDTTSSGRPATPESTPEPARTPSVGAARPAAPPSARLHRHLQPRTAGVPGPQPPPGSDAQEPSPAAAPCARGHFTCLPWEAAQPAQGHPHHAQAPTAPRPPPRPLPTAPQLWGGSGSGGINSCGFQSSKKNPMSSGE